MIIRFLGTHNKAALDTRLVSFIIDDILIVDAGNIVSDLSFDEQKRIRAKSPETPKGKARSTITVLCWGCRAWAL